MTELEARQAELERVLALADADSSPIFKAVLALIDEHVSNEHEAALQPNLSNEVRQFNAGRSASAYDLAHALRQHQENAARRAAEIQKTE